MSGTARRFKEGDRCSVCRYWYWERDGEGWHSLVPITFADTPELANEIDWCGKCEVEL